MAALSGFDLVTGLERAMIHYLAWGLAGFFAGDLMERIVEDSFRRRFLQTRTKEQATSPIRAEPTP